MAGTNNNLPGRSVIISFAFYALALLIWSIYDLVVNDKFGLQMPILLIGLAIYLWVKVVRQQKIIKASIRQN